MQQFPKKNHYFCSRKCTHQPLKLKKLRRGVSNNSSQLPNPLLFIYFALHYRNSHQWAAKDSNVLQLHFRRLNTTAGLPAVGQKEMKSFWHIFCRDKHCDVCLFSSMCLYHCREPKFFQELRGLVGCTKTVPGVPSVGRIQRASRQPTQGLRAVCTPCAVAVWWQKFIYTNHFTMLSQDSWLLPFVPFSTENTWLIRQTFSEAEKSWFISRSGSLVIKR